MILQKIFWGIVTVILFFMGMTFLGWIAFAVGPMRCSSPNQCTALQVNLYSILSLLVMSIPFVFLVISFKKISRL
jgi:hypothetical protein